MKSMLAIRQQSQLLSVHELTQTHHALVPTRGVEESLHGVCAIRHHGECLDGALVQAFVSRGVILRGLGASASKDAACDRVDEGSDDERE